MPALVRAAAAGPSVLVTDGEALTTAVVVAVLVLMMLAGGVIRAVKVLTASLAVVLLSLVLVGTVQLGPPVATLVRSMAAVV